MNESLKILFYGVPNKEVVLNYDFILDELLSFIDNENIITQCLSFDESKNSDEKFDIFVYHCIHPERVAHFGTSAPFEEVKSAVIRHNPKIIIQLIDEYWFENNEIHNTLGNYCELFLRQHRHHSHIPTYTENTLQIPLGYVNGFLKNKSKELKNVSDRKYVWSWVGNLKSDRKEMITTLLDIPNSIIHCDSMVETFDMHKIYSDSIFVPCGRGNASLDCWRIYEALVSGAIPIISGSKSEIECTFAFTELPPWIFVENWGETIYICDYLLNNKSLLQSIQNSILLWWSRTIQNIQTEIKKALQL